MNKQMDKKAIPTIRVALKDYRLYINQATLIKLGKPLYLRFLYNSEKKLFAITGTNNESFDCFKVPEKATNGKCYVSRMLLTEALRLNMSWNKNKNYSIEGEYLDNIGVTVFDLTCAMETDVK